jgi:hypothetical protein
MDKTMGGSSMGTAGDVLFSANDPLGHVLDVERLPVPLPSSPLSSLVYFSSNCSSKPNSSSGSVERTFYFHKTIQDF